MNKKGNLISTFIGKQEELSMRDSIDQLNKKIDAIKNILQD